ncbi:MAG TPA: hypothetical protein DDY68_00220 [Porphyromonadaceae bacterium]|nr:hypothetical protein [Porphyromonadaceae bacterium]
MTEADKSHNDLLYILGLLSKKREELISPFLNKDPEWIGLSFKYERNQSAFNVVKESFVTLWIDKHITQIIEDDMPDDVKNKAMELLSQYMSNSHSSWNDTEIKHSLLGTKLNILKELLKHEDVNSQKLNELRYSYEKDKALFEREFQKFEEEMKKESI